MVQVSVVHIHAHRYSSSKWQKYTYMNVHTQSSKEFRQRVPFYMYPVLLKFEKSFLIPVFIFFFIYFLYECYVVPVLIIVLTHMLKGYCLKDIFILLGCFFSNVVGFCSHDFRANLNSFVCTRPRGKFHFIVIVNETRATQRRGRLEVDHDSALTAATDPSR